MDIKALKLQIEALTEDIVTNNLSLLERLPELEELANSVEDFLTVFIHNFSEKDF